MAKNQPTPTSTAPTLSRRGFFTLAAALGVSTSSAFWEGFFVRAYADEVSADTTSYVIYVARRWEVPVCFLDVTDPANPQSVVGATVTIATTDGSKTATAVTDEYGVALVDITAIAEEEPDSDASVRTEYALYGSLVANAPGFRTFSTGKLRIRGGEQIDAPTRPVGDKSQAALPVIAQATINGWDILHAEDATFLQVKSDSGTGISPAVHEAVVKLENCKENVEVSLYQEGGTRHAATVSPSDGVAAVTFSAKLFSADAADAGEAFKPGEPILLSIASPAGETEKIETAAACEPGVSNAPMTEESAGAQGGLLSASSFLMESNGLSLVGIPEEFPVLGGGTFNFESILPSFPLSLAFYPSGHIVAGVGYAGTLHSKSNAGGMWQHDTFQDAKDEYRRSKEQWANTFKKYKSDRNTARLLGDKVPKCGKLSPISGFEMGFQCGGMLHMEYGDYAAEQGSRDKFTGSAQLYAILSGEYTYTMPFMVLYVPLYVRFQVSAALRATIDVGVGVTREEGKFHLSDGSSFSLNLKPELAVTLGVGAADLLSVGVRGSGYLSGYMGVNFQSVDGKPNPRLSLEGGAEVAIVIQAFMFKGSVELYSFDGVIADNWASRQAKRVAAGPSEASAGPSEALSAYVVDADGAKMRSSRLASAAFSVNAIPVTEGELLASAEFMASPKPVPMFSAGKDGERAAGAKSEESSESPSFVEPQHDLYDYQPIQRRRSMLRSGGAASALEAVGEGGAVVVGGLVAEDAYSDPRMKVVVVNDVPWMFRILTVNYGSVDAPLMRTRLSVAKWVSSSGGGAAGGGAPDDGSWGSAQVIDFAPVYDNASEPARIDLFDYDFAVLSASDIDGLGGAWADGGVVRVFLTSGTRDESTTDVGAAMSHTVGTFLSIGEDGLVKTARCFLDTYENSPVSRAIAGEACNYSTLVFPFVVHAFDSERGSVTGVFAFCRAATNAESLMDGPYEEHPATAFFDSNGNSVTGSLQFSYADGPQNNIEDYEAILSDVKSSVSVGILRSNIEGGNQIAIGCMYITRENESTPPVLKSFALLRNANKVSSQNDPGQVLPFGVCESGGLHASSPRFVYPWYAHGPGGALCAAGDGLFACAFTFGDSATSAPTGVAATPVSLDYDINLSSFALDPHSGMLYYLTTRVGKERPRSADGEIGEAVEVSDCRIWATRCITVEGRTGFMKPFPLLRTNQPIDSIEYLDFAGAFGFMANCIQSMQESTSSIALYRLPYLKRVTLVDFESVNQFVCPGDVEAFRITVRNDGNVSLSSFSVSVAIGGETQQLDFDLANRDLENGGVLPLAGVDDAAPVDGAGAAVADEPDGLDSAKSNSVVTGASFDLATQAGILNPGVTRSFEFLWRVPEDLSGSTPISVTVLENDSAAEGTQSSNGVSTGEGERFRNGAMFASALNGDIEPSNLESSALFRRPELKSAGDDDEAPDGEGGAGGDNPGGEGGGQNPDNPGDGGQGGVGGAGSGDQGDVGGGASDGSGDASDSADDDVVIPGESGGISNAGDSLASTATAVLLAGLGLAGMGVAAKELGD